MDQVGVKIKLSKKIFKIMTNIDVDEDIKISDTFIEKIDNYVSILATS